MYARWQAFGVLVCLGALGVASAATDDSLSGTWVAVKADRDGKAAPDVVGHQLSFQGDRFVIRAGDKVLYEGTVKNDASKKPAQIDFRHTAGALKGKTWLGIYERTGDRLITCDNAPDIERKRPTDFKAAPQSGLITIEFKRAP